MVCACACLPLIVRTECHRFCRVPQPLSAPAHWLGTLICCTNAASTNCNQYLCHHTPILKLRIHLHWARAKVTTKANANAFRWILRTFNVLSIFTTRNRSLGQGNVFTGVCDSVHRGCLVPEGGCLVPGVGGPGLRGVPGPKGGALSGRGLVPACLAAFQAHTQGGSLGGSGQGGPQAHIQGGSWGGSGPGPHPRGKLRGIWSRPTPKGEVEGDLVQAQPPPFPVTATAAAGTHPTGMHSCVWR